MNNCVDKKKLWLFKKEISVFIPPKFLKCCKIDKKMFKCFNNSLLNDSVTSTLPFKWSNLPKKTETIIIEIVDTTCTYMCNGSCKFVHWKGKFKLDELEKLENYKEIFYVDRNGVVGGIKINGIRKLGKFTLKNSAKLRTYIPFCAPKFQIHAHVIILTVLDEKNQVIAKSQSTPFLI